MKNKYVFFKRIYKEYVIVFDYQGKRKSIGNDKELMRYIRNNDINYIIVYNDFTIRKVTRKNNNYNKYLMQVFIEKLMNSTIK